MARDTRTQTRTQKARQASRPPGLCTGGQSNEAGADGFSGDPQRGVEPGQRKPSEDVPQRGLKIRHALSGVVLVVAAATVYQGAKPWLGGAGGIDAPTQQQIEAMNTEFKAMLDSGGVQLAAVVEEDRPAVIAQLPLSATDKQNLTQQAAQRSQDFVWITVFDNVAEDGDVVALTSNGVRVVVPIFHQRTRIALPRPADGHVFLEGVNDGGGGVTVSVISGDTPVPIPPMEPGQTVAVPVK